MLHECQKQSFGRSFSAATAISNEFLHANLLLNALLKMHGVSFEYFTINTRASAIVAFLTPYVARDRSVS